MPSFSRVITYKQSLCHALQKSLINICNNVGKVFLFESTGIVSVETNTKLVNYIHSESNPKLLCRELHTSVVYLSVEFGQQLLCSRLEDRQICNSTQGKLAFVICGCITYVKCYDLLRGLVTNDTPRERQSPFHLSLCNKSLVINRLVSRENFILSG